MKLTAMNTPELKIPNDGWQGLKENFKSDALSGFLVFLIALPLCIGISNASGFPPLAGIFTAIIGGMVVSIFMGSPLTIKGPAAGLIVITLGAVTDLGDAFYSHLPQDQRMAEGYKLALATIVVSGIIQVIFGLVKAGKLSDLFPASVMHGMLAAIGIIIAAKQIHILLGVNTSERNPIALLGEIPHSISVFNPYVTIIGITSLLILIFMPRIKNETIKKIPPALVVLLVAVLLGFAFNLNETHTYSFAGNIYPIIPDEFLVKLKSSLFESITLPEFRYVFSWISIKYIVLFSVIGSVESLLSSKAIDLLDPYKRSSNLNKDLVAVGAGNTLAGFIGGLPMISEIVRSSNNINNGGKTRWANFFHGLFLLLFVTLAIPLIGMIPFTALAAMLIVIGYRLTSPKEFYHTYKVGSEQLVIMLITIVAILMTDLFIGIFIGIAAKFIMHIIFGVSPLALFKADVAVKEISRNHFQFSVKGAAIFSNYSGVKKMISRVPDKSHVELDFSATVVIDHTFMEHIKQFQKEFEERGGIFEVTGLDYHRHLSDHPLATRRLVNDGSNNFNKVLNPRQRRIKIFAEQNGFSYDPRVATNPQKFSDLPYSKAHRVMTEENVMARESNALRVEISDIQVQENIQGETVEYSMTKVYIKDPNIRIPDFVLEETLFIDESFLDEALADIDFDSHPDFSNHYLLRGKDDKAIRHFFNADLLDYMEKHKGYHIEAKNNKILIYKEPCILTVDELKKALRFTEGFLEVIHKVKVPH